MCLKEYLNYLMGELVFIDFLHQWSLTTGQIKFLIETWTLFPNRSAKVIYANGTEKYFTYYTEILCMKFAFCGDYDRKAEMKFVYSTHWKNTTDRLK